MENNTNERPSSGTEPKTTNTTNGSPEVASSVIVRPELGPTVREVLLFCFGERHWQEGLDLPISLVRKRYNGICEVENDMLELGKDVAVWSMPKHTHRI